MHELPKLPPGFMSNPGGRRVVFQVSDDWLSPGHDFIFVACPWKLLTDRPGQERILKHDYAVALGRWAISRGAAPFVPVLQAETLGLCDEIEEDRIRGIELGHHVLRRCEAILAGVDGGVTPGMMDEIDIAKLNHIPRLWVSLPTWAQTFRQFGCAVDWGQA